MLNSQNLFEISLPFHLKASTWLAPISSGDTSLPYYRLGGAGFERLCYLLLLEQGHVPRYFGKPGQEQYGIDLVITVEGQHSVFQCKNVARFGSAEMKEVLSHFESEWLARSDLPIPKRFVICCPLDLRDAKQSAEWLKLERKFGREYGLELICWDRSYFDERLRNLPDLVADLFSGRIAESYCDLPDWNEGLFRQLRPNSGDHILDHYQALASEGRIFIASQVVEAFAEGLDRSGSILILGPPGSGKTTTSLALSAGLDDGRYRVFYVDLRYDCSESDLVIGIKRRLTRPTITIVDNCQTDFNLTHRLRERLRQLALNRPALLVLLARNTPTPPAMLRDDPELVLHLREEEAVIDLHPQPIDFREIIARRNPTFDALSETRLRKIYDITGHDLALLNQVLDNLDEPAEIDDFDLETLFRGVLRRYFPGQSFLPGFLSLGALAQFDIAPLASVFSLEQIKIESQYAKDELVLTAGRPPRHIFLHSSAAELIAKAIAWRHASKDFAADVAASVADYLASLAHLGVRATEDLLLFMHNHLRLTDSISESRLKRIVLADQRVFDLFLKGFEDLPLTSLAFCLSNDLSGPELGPYWGLIHQKIDDGDLLTKLIQNRSAESAEFFALLHQSPLSIEALRTQVKQLDFQNFPTTTSLHNIISLLVGLADSRDPWWGKILTQIPEASIDLLVQQIDENGLRLLTNGLNALKLADPELHAILNRRIGAAKFLDLVLHAGSILDLLKLLTVLSPPDAEDLIARLDHKGIDKLVMNTIASGKSIGTLHLSLRALMITNKALLSTLETKIGAERFLTLLDRLGTIIDLFRILQYSSPALAAQIIEALNDQLLEALVDRTLASGRPIGTLHHALRHLKLNEPQLLLSLEKKLGGHRYIRLIGQPGTLPDLFSIVEYCSLPLARELVGVLSENDLDALVRRTLISERSVSTFHMSLRALRKSNPEIQELLEHKIGATRYTRLLAESGTIVGLFRLVSSSAIAIEVISLLDDRLLDTLVGRTILKKQSVAWLPLILFQIRSLNEDLLLALDRVMGAPRYLHLIISSGDLVDLFALLREASQTIAADLISLLDSAKIDYLIDKAFQGHRSIAWLAFTFRKIRKTNDETAQKLEERIGAERFVKLISAAGTMPELFSLMQYLSPPMVSSLIDLLDPPILDLLVERTIATGRSVGTLSFALRRLRKEMPAQHVAFERRVGSDRLWRLVAANGNFQAFSNLSNQITPPTRADFLSKFLEASDKELSEITTRSTFAGIASSLRWHFARTPLSLTEAKLSCMQPHVVEMVERESWEALSKGWETLSDAPNSTLKKLLIATAKGRLASIDSTDLRRWPFSEAVSCIALLWQEEPSRLQTFKHSPLAFLPNKTVWLSEKGFMRAARLLLSILCSYDAPLADKREVLAVCNCAEIDTICSQARPSELLPFLWNLYSVWYVLQPTRERAKFARFLNPRVGVSVCELTLAGAYLKTNADERDSWIALIGFLTFVGLPPSIQGRRGWAARLSSLEKTYPAALEKNFVPASFLLLGLEWIFDSSMRIPRLIWQKLLLRIDSLNSAALKDLQRFAMKRAHPSSKGSFDGRDVTRKR